MASKSIGESLVVEYAAMTDPVDIAIASHLLYIYNDRLKPCAKFNQQHTMLRRGRIDRLPKRLYDPRVREYFFELARDYCSKEKAYLKEVLLKEAIGMAQRYKYAYFIYISVIGSPATALAVVANPPDLTLAKNGAPLVKTGSWMNLGFTSVKGKVWRVTIEWKVIRRELAWLFLKPEPRLAQTPRLLDFYMKKIWEYEARGRTRGAAATLAAKDVIRAVYGAAWLVAMLDALERGAIKKEWIVLPYELAKAQNPYEVAKTMLQPADMVPKQNKPGEWATYTWTRLLKELGYAP